MSQDNLNETLIKRKTVLYYVKAMRVHSERGLHRNNKNRYNNNVLRKELCWVNVAGLWVHITLIICLPQATIFAFIGIFWVLIQSLFSEDFAFPHISVSYKYVHQ